MFELHVLQVTYNYKLGIIPVDYIACINKYLVDA
jgi:hypothetical protein